MSTRVGPDRLGGRWVSGARIASFLGPASLALLAVSCAPRTPAFDRARLTAELREPLADWTRYWCRYDPAFTLDSLRWSVVDSIRVERTERLPDSVRTGRASAWFAWSPDRTRAVDPDAYRVWDPGQKRFRYEPEAVSELLDFPTHTGSFLQSCGTSCRNDDARWLDRERFALVGWEDADDGDSLFGPVVRVYDLDRRTTAVGVGRAVSMPRTPAAGDTLADAPRRPTRAERVTRWRPERGSRGATRYLSLRRTSAARRSLASTRVPSLRRSTSTPSSPP